MKWIILFGLAVIGIEAVTSGGKFTRWRRKIKLSLAGLRVK